MAAAAAVKRQGQAAVRACSPACTNMGLRFVVLLVIFALLSVGCSASADTTAVAVQDDAASENATEVDSPTGVDDGPVDVEAADAATPSSEATAAAESEAATSDVAAGTTDLASISLATPRVEELDPVQLADLPADVDPSTIEVVVMIDDELSLPVEVLIDDAGGAYFYAPLNPNAPGQAGTTEVFITDGVNSGPPLTLELTALPPAPGATSAYVQSVWDQIDQEAQALGSSMAELQATSFEDTPDELFRLKLLQGLVDDGSPNDMMSLLSAEGSGLTVDEMALVDAVIAKTDPQASIRPPSPSGAPPPPGPPPSGPDTLEGTGTIIAGQETCRSSDIPVIKTVEDLVQELGVGVDARGLSNNSAVTRVKRQFGLASLVTGIGTPIVIAGTVHTLNTNFDAGRYPSQLSAITFDVSTTTFNADFKEEGVWSNVRLSATSTGHNAVQDVVALGTSVLGFGAGTAKNVAEAGLAGELATRAVDVGGELAQTASGKLLTDPEFTRFCAHTWTVDVPFSNGRYVIAESARGMLDIDQRGYKPNAAGEGRLVVKAVPAAFHELMVFDFVDIETTETVVLVEPNEVEVMDPGEVVEISVTFANSDSERVKWSASAGEFIDGLGDITEGEVTRQLRTPASLTDYDAQVSATLEPEEGALGLYARDSERPEDSALLSLADLIVTPDGATIGRGRTVSYSATTAAGDPVDVEWSAGGGTIDNDGVYTAGNETGTYTVTATAVETPLLTGTASVTVADFVVNPAGARVTLGGSVTYVASTFDGQTVEVDWSAGGGSIDDGGVYVAGNTPGTYTVTATLKSDPSITVTVEVEVVERACLVGAWSIRLPEMAAQLSASTPEGSFTYDGGSYIINLFEDGTFVAERIELTFALLAQGQELLLQVDAVERGTYVAIEEMLTISETSSVGEGTIGAGGVVFSSEIPDGATVRGSGPYECTEQVLTVTLNGFMSILDYIGPPVDFE